MVGVMRQKREYKPKSIVIRMRRVTHEKFRVIAKSRRWPLIEAFDAVADEFLSKEAVPVNNQDRVLAPVS